MLNKAYRSVLFAIIFSISFSQVVINELMIQPYNDSDEVLSEYIELYNIGQDSVDLEGWQVAVDDFSSYFTISNLVMGPESYAVLSVSDNELFNLGIPVDFAWGFAAGFSLPNAFSNITICDTGDYCNSRSYEIENIEAGKSVELKNPLYLGGIGTEYWSAGSEVYDSAGNMGTPGAQNSSYVPVPALSVSDLDFGITQFGTPTTLSLTFYSIGEQAVIISDIYDVEGGVSTFSYTLPELPLTLQPGENYNLDITYDGAEADFESYIDLAFITNSVPNNNFNINIKGQAGTPYFNLYTGASFDDTYVTSSDTSSVLFENSGTYTLNISNAYLEGENTHNFEILSAFPMMISPQSTEPIEIVFSPSQPFEVYTSLVVEHDDFYYSDSSIYQTTISGYGIMPEINLNENSHDFGTIRADETASKFVNIQNSGNGDLIVDLNFESGDYFSFHPGDDSLVISEGGETQSLVYFNPSYVGDYSDILVINSNDPVTPQIQYLVSGSALSGTLVLVPFDSPTVQGGINLAEEGDTVLVDPGVYNTTNLSFLGKAITVASHFIMTGDTSYISSTVLDGGNADRVVYFRSEEDSTSVLDGFTIQNGSRDSYDSDSTDGSLGGAKGSGITVLDSSPTLNNLIVKNNENEIRSGYSDSGGAIYLWDSSSVINNTLIVDNFITTKENSYSGDYCGGSGLYVRGGNVTLNNVDINSNYFVRVDGYNQRYSGGAGVYNRGNLEINDSNISNNIADIDYYRNGGGIYNYSGLITLNNTTVHNNQANERGGGIFNYSGTINLNNSSVSFNLSANHGGGICNDQNAGDINVNGSNIDSNQISNSYNGGGIYSYYNNVYIQSSSISNNTGAYRGGGIYFYRPGSDSFISNSIINNNEAGENGGGIYGFEYNISSFYNINFTISETEIKNNSSGNKGGGIFWDRGQFTMNNSQVRFNSANEGGGIHISNKSLNPIFQFVEISNNTAQTIGGGLYINKDTSSSTTPIIFNSTIINNTAAILGSGIICINETNPVIQNAILRDNLAADGVQVHLQGGSEVFVTYSNVAGGLSGIVGFDDIIYQNNIDVDPVFTDAENYDYSLQVTSPCIDAGNPNSPNDPDGTIADMGSYFFDQDEFNPGCMDESAQNFDVDANVDLGCIYGPSFISVYDAPDDQGGYVFLNWNANSLDVLPNTDITHYSVWRFLPNQRGWEHLVDIPASYEESYGFTAPTIETSVEGDEELLTTFKVKAHTDNQEIFYESGEGTGYSLDNLTPSAPEEIYSDFDVESNSLVLDWDLSSDPDIAFYNIYRDGSLIAQVNDNMFYDQNTTYTQGYEYSIEVFDFYNNHSSSQSFLTYCGIAGDAYADQLVNVIDIVKVVNIIFETQIPNEYEFWAADVIDDSIINVLDIVEIVSIIVSVD